MENNVGLIANTIVNLLVTIINVIQLSVSSTAKHEAVVKQDYF